MNDDLFNWNAAIEEEPAQAEAMLPEVEDLDLPAVQEFDTVPAAAKLEFYRHELDLILERAKGVKIIRDDATNTQCIEWATQAKKLHRRLEDLRHLFVDPHHQYKTKVDRFFKPFTSRLEEVQRYLTNLSGSYRWFLENERKKAQAEQDAAAKEIEQKAAEEAAAAATEGVIYTPPPMPKPIVPEVPKVIHTSSGSASHRQRWTFEVVDESLLDREFLVPDRKKIQERVNGGLRESPGLRIYSEFITQIRGA